MNLNEKHILLIRPGYQNIFARTGPILTEPLELEYLATVAKQVGFKTHIHDSLIDKQSIIDKVKRLKPEVVAISGYFLVRKIMITLMEEIRSISPDITIIAGGVDIEVCFEDYYGSCADILVYSGGVTAFKSVLKNLKSGVLDRIDGICYRDSMGMMLKNPPCSMDLDSIPIPDRTHFNRHKSRYNYLGYGETALVKGAFSCPYSCSFCYARLLNQGVYAARSIDAILDEISGINAPTIWMVDDIFLPDEQRALDFIKGVKDRSIKKNFIIYSRADFICDNESLIAALKESGVVEVIVGLEAVDDKELNSYHKGSKSNVNSMCVKILKESEINVTALFIAGLDADLLYFLRLLKWIVLHGINTFTVSVFTPIPGTRDYEKYKPYLTTLDPRKWDFMHLVLKPEKTGVRRFYIYLWSLYIFQVLSNPRQLYSLMKHRFKRKSEVNIHAAR